MFLLKALNKENVLWTNNYNTENDAKNQIEVFKQNGSWSQYDNITYSIEDVSPKPQTDDQKWKIIRNKRNALLAECDWSMLGDAPLNKEQKAIMANYRNKLRNLPATASDPDAIIFPEYPKL